GIDLNNLKIVIGAGEYNDNPGWLLKQESELNLLKRDNWAKRFNPNTVDAILAEHVWEHRDYAEGKEAACMCYEFLKRGRYIRCAVTHCFFTNEEYHRGVQIGGPGPKDHPAASHKIVHNYKTITKMFEEAGFEVSLLEYCDEVGEFHYNDWDVKKGFIYRSK